MSWFGPKQLKRGSKKGPLFDPQNGSFWALNDPQTPQNHPKRVISSVKCTFQYINGPKPPKTTYFDPFWTPFWTPPSERYLPFTLTRTQGLAQKGSKRGPKSDPFLDPKMGHFGPLGGSQTPPGVSFLLSNARSKYVIWGSGTPPGTLLGPLLTPFWRVQGPNHGGSPP